MQTEHAVIEASNQLHHYGTQMGTQRQMAGFEQAFWDQLCVLAVITDHAC